MKATCTDSGHNAYETCSRCNYTTYEEIPARGHSESDWIISENPTCTEDGSKYIKCRRCEEILQSSLIDKLGHEESDWIIDLSPTCLIDGGKYKKCERCEKILEAINIEKLGHNLVYSNKKEPTCTINGYEAYEKCTRCSYTTYKIIPALGHKESDWIIDLSPTCLIDGGKYKKCERCEKILEAINIEKLGHNLVYSNKKEPTCTINGYEAYEKCTRCSYTTYKIIPALGHKESYWIIDTSPTCLNTGVKHKECLVCNKTIKRVVVQALGHDIENYEKLDATCIKDGHNAYEKCSRCDYTTYENILALGHKESDWIIDKNPTCTMDGLKHIECTRCKETLSTNYINKLGHKESDWIIDKEPTNKEEGSKHIECDICGELLHEEKIDKLPSKNNKCNSLSSVNNLLNFVSLGLFIFFMRKKRY